MRIGFVAPASGRRLALFVLLLFPSAGARHAVPLRYGASVLAQNPDTMSPAANEAKARELLAQMIQALGGDAYLGVKEVYRHGRIAYFDSNGVLGGYSEFWRYNKLPDKARAEYSALDTNNPNSPISIPYYRMGKRNIMDVFNGSEGWSLDRAGVNPKPPDLIQAFQAGLKKDLNLLLRTRMNEPGLRIRYAGVEIIDLQRMELVEITDSERRITRIAILPSTHLPMRVQYITRSRETQERTEDTEFLANYQVFQGVQTPTQTRRFLNGRPQFQMFLREVQYNSGISDALFTKQSLDEAWVKLGKK